MQVTLGDKPVIVDPSKLFGVDLQFPDQCVGGFEYFVSTESDSIIVSPFKQHRIENGMLVMEATQFGVQSFFLIGQYVPSAKITAIPY